MCSPAMPTYNINIPEYNVENFAGKAVIVIGPDFTYDEVVSINKAVDNWNVSTNGNFAFEIIPPDWDIIKGFVGKKLPNGRCYDVIGINMITPFHQRVAALDKRNNKRILGYAVRNECSSSPIKIITFRINNNQQMVWVTMHELGHAIGLKHVYSKKSLMYKFRNDENKETSCIKKQDMQQLCLKLGCDIKTTMYCLAN